MIREVPTRQLVIGQHLLLQIEPIQRAPRTAHFSLYCVVAAETRHAKRFVRRRLWRVLDEPQRRSECQAAEANVRDPHLVFDVDLQQHVRSRPDRILGMIPQHARREASDPKPDAFERVLEQQVVLVAVAAALLLHHLVLQRLRVERHRPMQQRIQILERDGLRVQAMDLAECFESARYGRSPS